MYKYTPTLLLTSIPLALFKRPTQNAQRTNAHALHTHALTAHAQSHLRHGPVRVVDTPDTDESPPSKHRQANAQQ